MKKVFMIIGTIIGAITGIAVGLHVLSVFCSFLNINLSSLRAEDPENAWWFILLLYSIAVGIPTVGGVLSGKRLAEWDIFSPLLVPIILAAISFVLLFPVLIVTYICLVAGIPGVIAVIFVIIAIVASFVKAANTITVRIE